MQKIKITTLIILNICFVDALSQNTSIYTIYDHLYDFLIKSDSDNDKDITLSKDMISRDVICINNILDTTILNGGININEKISVYEFYVNTNSHPNVYFLIKEFESFYIYDKKNVCYVIKHLLQIKEKHSELITDKKFVDFVERLIYKYNDILVSINLGNGIRYVAPYEKGIFDKFSIR